MDIFDMQSSPAAAALEPAPVAGTIDEDQAHGLRCGGKEVSATVPVLLHSNFRRATACTRRHYQPEIGLVDQRRSL
jgi:hypothetical protein